MTETLPHRRLALLAACAALVVIPPVQAGAKKVVRTATKTLCADVGSLPVPDGPARADFVSAQVSTGKRCPKKLVCGYGGLPLGAKVRDVDAFVRVTHPSVADLTVLLVNPTGGLSTLAAGDGGAGDDFGAGGTGCAAAFTTFDDAASTPIQGAPPALAPFAGSFAPRTPLALHNGSFGSGDWRLYFDDAAAGNAGTVDAAGIRLTYRFIVRKRKR